MRLSKTNRSWLPITTPQSTAPAAGRGPSAAAEISVRGMTTPGTPVAETRPETTITRRKPLKSSSINAAGDGAHSAIRAKCSNKSVAYHPTWRTEAGRFTEAKGRSLVGRLVAPVAGARDDVGPLGAGRATRRVSW